MPVSRDGISTARRGLTASAYASRDPTSAPEPRLVVRVAVRSGDAAVGDITAVVRTAVFQQALERQVIPKGWVTEVVGKDGRFNAATHPARNKGKV